MSPESGTAVSAEAWALVAQLIAAVPPGADLERHRDVFGFLAALDRARDRGHRGQASAAAQIVVSACDVMDIDRFYALARGAWRVRAGGPTAGPRFWRRALTVGSRSLELVD